MTPFVHEFYVNLRTGAAYERAKKPLSQGNAFADKIVVHVQDCGKDVDLSGMGVSALVVRFDGQTVPLMGTIEDGAACVTLDKDSYAVPGEARVTVMLSAGEMVQTVLVLLLNVDASQTSIIVDNATIGDLTDLLGAIAEMRTATAEAIDAAEAANAAVDNVNTALTNVPPNIVADANGAMVSVHDASARPAVQAVTGISVQQSGAGTPSPDNIRPITGWDAAGITRTGKNLVDISEYVDADAANIRAATADKFAAVKYKESTQYTISMQISTEDTTSMFGMMVTYSDGSTGYNWIKTGDKYVASVSTAAGKTVAAITLSYNTRFVLSLSNVQLEEGAVATSYEPYQSVKLSADLPETVYGGTLDWTSGVLTVTHAPAEVTAFDTLYTDVGSGLTCGQANRWPGMRAGGGADGWCEALTPVASIKGRTEPCMSFGGTSSAAIYAAYPAATVGTTLEALNAYVASNPLRVVYPLAEPYTIQLTPQQLTLLKGNNAIWSSTGDTSLVYIADTKLYIDNAIAAIAASIINS